MARIGVLTNPNSGKNRQGANRVRALEAALGRHGVVRQTGELADVEVALAEFLDLGCDYWVCDGGDGTLHWMLTIGRRLVQARRDAGVNVVFPRVLPANGGSIDFVAHKAGVHGQAPELIGRLVHCFVRDQSPTVVSLDTLRVQGRGLDGRHFDHVGFATALGGIAQRLFGKLYERKPVDAWSICRVVGKSTAGAVLGHAPGLLASTFSAPLRDAASFADEVFMPTSARVDVDGQPLPFDSFSSLQVGSIDINLGGVVRTFRHARHGGVLHAQAICSTPLQLVANLPNLVLGTPIWGKQVFDGPAESMRVRAFEGGSLDPVIDGEVFTGLAELEVTRGFSIAVPQMA